MEPVAILSVEFCSLWSFPILDGVAVGACGGDHHLHLLAPGGAAQQLQDSNPGGRKGAEVVDVGSEGE